MPLTDYSHLLARKDPYEPCRSTVATVNTYKRPSPPSTPPGKLHAHLKITRIAFKDRGGIATELALTGCRKKDLAGWLAQTSQFYTNVLANEQTLAGLA